MVTIKYRLPSRRELRTIHEAAERGISPKEIAKAVLGVGTTHVVNAILREPEMYDPYIDEVAVQRALEGEQGVWDSLTYYERREVILRHRETEPGVTQKVWGFPSTRHLGAAVQKLRKYQ